MTDARPSTNPNGGAALALDWNGTVVADEERAFRAVRHALRSVGRPSSDGIVTFRQRWRLPLTDFFAQYGVLEGQLATAEAVWNAAMVNGEVDLARGARDLLVWCAGAGIPVFIVSGADATVVRADARAHGIHRYLTAVMGRAHPKANFLRSLHERHGRVVFVGDSEYDIAEARAAGVVTLAFGGGYRPAEALRATGVTVVDDLREVAAFLSADHQSAHLSV